MSSSSQSRTPVVEAFLFDFGNVISSFDPVLFVHALSRLTGRPVQQLAQILKNSSPIFHRYETGLMSSEEFAAALRTACGIAISTEDLRTAYTHIFAPIPSTIELIKSLKPHYRLGLVSNTSPWHFEYSIRRVEVYPLFDAVSLSFEVKAMKPAAAMYDDVLAKLGVQPEHCIYVDDLMENVEGARNRGMTALHYTSYASLMHDLQPFHIQGLPATSSHGI